MEIDPIAFSSRSFWLGVIVTIIVSIIANLLTPERRSLLGYFYYATENLQNWLAKQSAKRTEKKIAELKAELDMIFTYVNSEIKLSRLLSEETIYILFDFCVGTAIFALSLILPVFTYNLLMGVLSLFFYLRAIQRGGRVKNILFKVHNYDEYKADKEKRIGALEEASKARASRKKLVVLSAKYGAGDRVNDVTRLLNSKISRNKLEIHVTNDLGGDPSPGSVKQLEILYSYKGQEHSLIISEGQLLSLPEQNS